MNIRMATETDFSQWLLLWKGYQVFYKADIADSTTETTWSRFHDVAEPMHCAVAEVEGRLIGMVHYIQHRSCWTTGDYVYFYSINKSLSLYRINYLIVGICILFSLVHYLDND